MKLVLEFMSSILKYFSKFKANFGSKTVPKKKRELKIVKSQSHRILEIHFAQWLVGQSIDPV